MPDVNPLLATPSPTPGPSPTPDATNPFLPQQHKKPDNPLLSQPRVTRRQASTSDLGKQFLGTPEKLWSLYRSKAPGIPEIPGDASHSAADQLFSLPDYYTIDLLNSVEMGKLKDWSTLNPAEATDKYGFDSKDFTNWVLHSGRFKPTDWAYKHAKLIQKNPTAGALETFLWEFVNPGQLAMGGGMGHAGNVIYDYLRLSEKGRLFLNLFSPFRGVAKVSERAKWALMAMVNATRHADETAFNDVYNIFNGLTKEEQIDVVRRMQKAKWIPPGYDKPRLPQGQHALPGHPTYEHAGRSTDVSFGEPAPEMQPEVGTLERGGTFVAGPGKIHPRIAAKKGLDLRAKKLALVLRKTTAQQKELGILKPGQIFDDERYFPMYGAYNDPSYEPDDFIQGLRTLQGGAPYSAPRIQQKHFLDIDTALGSGQVRKDWTPANQLMRHLSRRRQTIMAQDYLGNHPGFGPEVIRRPGEADVRQNLHAENLGPEVRVERRRAKPALGAEPPASQMLPKSKPVAGSNIMPRQELPATPEEDLGYAYKRAAKVQGTQFARNTIPKGWIEADKALPGVKLVPALQGAIIKTEFGDWLREHGGSMMSGEPVYLLFKSMLGSKSAEWLNRYNTSYRAAIIANPAYHLLWNIVWNGSAAMGKSPLNLVTNTGRAIAGIARSTIPGLDSFIKQYGEKALGDRFNTQAQAYASDLREAIQAGATAEWGGPRSALGTMKSIDLFTQPWGSLKFGQKMDRLASGLQEWNRRAVFGPLGEQKFAVTLYSRTRDRLVKQGWSLNDAQGRAAELTREALGNYQNVDPNDILSQMFFFYPWLKSNTIFWAKQFLTNPSYTAGPLLGIRRYNQTSGDPNFDVGRFSTPDFNISMGKNKQNQDQYMTPALPQRIPVAMMNAAARALPGQLGGQGDLMAPIQEGQRLAESHANPAAAFGTGLATTALEQMRADIDPHVGANYDVIFEKDAPLHEKLTETMTWGADHAIPMPFIQYTVEDMIRTGVPASEIPGKLRDNLGQIVGGGYVHAKDSQKAGLAVYRAHSAFEKQVKAAQRAYDHHQLTASQLQARINLFYKTYARKRDTILRGNQ